MLKNKKILLTGMTGQLGESLAMGLASDNEVWGLARYSAPGSRERVEALGVRTLQCDYTTNNFEGVPDDFEYVLHAAAAVSPKSSEEGMVQNAEGTGFLLAHCREARGFIYVSTTGVYRDQPEQTHRYVETDQLGGMSPHSPYYGVTKAAGEAVTRTVGRLFNVPTTILRMNVSYGRGGHGGLPGVQLDKLIRGEPIIVPSEWPAVYHVPIHEDDLVAQIGPAFEVANVKTTIMNWGGNDMVSTEEWVRFMGALTGIEPNFKRTQEGITWSRAADPTRRDALIGPCKVHWRDGMRRLIQDRHPEIPLRDL
jgi:UDP-glucuronate 4-epimerase